jgi:sulfopyruvate decarboxylase TPP-binding subunit
MEELNRVMKALEILNGTQASISVSLPICDEVKNFILSIREEYPINYISNTRDDRNLELNIQTKNVPIRCFDCFLEFPKP